MTITRILLAATFVVAPLITGLVLRHVTPVRTRANDRCGPLRPVLLGLAVAATLLGPFEADRRLRTVLLVLALGLAAAWLALEARSRERYARIGALIALVGVTLNLIPILANGEMPFNVAAARAASVSITGGPRNVPAGPHTEIAPLGDSIPLPGLRKVISPGDILLAIGIVTLAATTSSTRRQRAEASGINAR
jgi:hypothetical protein